MRQIGLEFQAFAVPVAQRALRFLSETVMSNAAAVQNGGSQAADDPISKV